MRAEDSSPPHNDIKLCSNEVNAFDWAGRWLKGHEYAYILNNIDKYCDKFGFHKYSFKKHPSSIYDNPISTSTFTCIDGMIYFVEGKGVGSDFGFPRVAAKKKYRWKKMNFTTNLPKKKPDVTYVVASAMKSQPIDTETPEFRMHAVIPYEQSSQQQNHHYILCHVREVDQKNEECMLSLQECFLEGHCDFYKLLAYLHNLQNERK